MDELNKIQIKEEKFLNNENICKCEQSDQNLLVWVKNKDYDQMMCCDCIDKLLKEKDIIISQKIKEIKEKDLEIYKLKNDVADLAEMTCKCLDKSRIKKPIQKTMTINKSKL